MKNDEPVTERFHFRWQHIYSVLERLTNEAATGYMTLPRC